VTPQGTTPPTPPNAISCATAHSLAEALFIVEGIGRHRSVWAALDEQPRWQRWTVYYLFAVAFAALALTAPQHAPTPFIYFQF